jgi:hypothetical protein
LLSSAIVEELELVWVCCGWHKWPSVAPDSHLLRVAIPDTVLIKFDLPRMSKILLETCTCRGM